MVSNRRIDCFNGVHLGENLRNYAFTKMREKSHLCEISIFSTFCDFEATGKVKLFKGGFLAIFFFSVLESPFDGLPSGHTVSEAFFRFWT